MRPDRITGGRFFYGWVIVVAAFVLLAAGHAVIYAFGTYFEPLPPEDQRRRLFEGLTELLAGLARRRPLVLLLDDLQWAPGLALLNHVTRQIGAARVLLLGTARPAADLQQRLLAQGLLGRALAIWEPMGAAPYVEKCRQKLAELG